MAGSARLSGTVKYYDWGGFSFIPSLLNTLNKEKKPFAEYWMGVHPQADCRVGIDTSAILLREMINESGRDVLGKYVFERFGNMPFLLKVLDVRNMLSIQVHPSKREAEKGFARENEARIPLDSPERNYKDDNHKPELMVAMGEFWLLHGFKPPEEMKRILETTPELVSLLPVFKESDYSGLYARVMEMPQAAVNAQLKPLLDRIIPLYQEGQLKKSDPAYWAAKGALTFSQEGNTDRGIFSIYLFNLIRLNKGEAIFQDAGVPHAYLEGLNVEIMSSSDNVLRGGLTTKHIDVGELLKHVKCEATHPNILIGTEDGVERIYKTPAPDFELSAFAMKKNSTASFIPFTAEVLLLMEGQVEFSNGDTSVVLKKGSPSGIVFPGHEIKLSAAEASLVFRASVPGKIENRKAKIES